MKPCIKLNRNLICLAHTSRTSHLAGSVDGSVDGSVVSIIGVDESTGTSGILFIETSVHARRNGNRYLILPPCGSKSYNRKKMRNLYIHYTLSKHRRYNTVLLLLRLLWNKQGSSIYYLKYSFFLLFKIKRVMGLEPTTI